MYRHENDDGQPEEQRGVADPTTFLHVRLLRRSCLQDASQRRKKKALDRTGQG
jgi:hypothetical protein